MSKDPGTDDGFRVPIFFKQEGEEAVTGVAMHLDTFYSIQNSAGAIASLDASIYAFRQAWTLMQSGCADERCLSIARCAAESLALLRNTLMRLHDGVARTTIDDPAQYTGEHDLRQGVAGAKRDG